MTKQDLKNILDYCEKATDAPWPYGVCLTLQKIEKWSRRNGSGKATENVQFVSYARSDLPALAEKIYLLLENYGLDSIDELEQELIKCQK